MSRVLCVECDRYTCICCDHWETHSPVRDTQANTLRESKASLMQVCTQDKTQFHLETRCQKCCFTSENTANKISEWASCPCGGDLTAPESFILWLWKVENDLITWEEAGRQIIHLTPRVTSLSFWSHGADNLEGLKKDGFFLFIYAVVTISIAATFNIYGMSSHLGRRGVE